MSSASVLNRIAAEEGELDRMYARDTLSHLEQLLQQTKSLQTLQQSSDDAARAARELRSKVAALRAEHSELQRQLKTTPRDAVRDVVAKEASNVIAATNGASVAGFDESAAAQATRAQLLARVHEQTERRALDELHTAYRLTGKTIVKLKDQLGGATALRFDTCFDGRFFETYYVLLGRDDANPDLYTLEKHTLPYFVPLRELAQQLLNVDFPRFLDITSDFVNALVARRQQCEALKRFAAIESLHATDAFDYVQLNILAWSDIAIVVFAVFDNPRSHKPTRVEVTQTGANGAPEALDDITAKLLLYNRLDEALITVFQLRE